MSGEAWLTKRELAEHLRVHPRTIERLRLPINCRVGGQNRYLLSEVLRYLRHGDDGDGGSVVRFPRQREKETAA